MESTIDVTGDVRSKVLLQLAGAATSQSRMLSVRQLYNNIQRFSDCPCNYSEFLQYLEDIRDELDIGDGEIGADINYISLKKGN